MRKLRVLTLILGLLSISLGGSIYLFFRSEKLPMFEWVKAMGIYDLISSMRIENCDGGWLIYSLPDGLWLFSYILIMAALWSFDEKRTMLYSVPLVIIAIGSESLQYFHLISGTFDVIDLLCYIGANVFGFVYVKIIINNLKLNKR